MDDLDLDVRSNLAEVAGFVGRAMPKQTEYAGRVALTRTVQRIQKDTRQAVPRVFDGQNAGALKHIERGVVIDPARKGRAVAEVYSRDAFMDKHLTEQQRFRAGEWVSRHLGKFSAVKREKIAGIAEAGRLIAVPTPSTARARRIVKGKAGKRPGAFVADPKNRAFMVPGRGGAAAYILMRTGRKKKKPHDRARVEETGRFTFKRGAKSAWAPGTRGSLSDRQRIKAAGEGGGGAHQGFWGRRLDPNLHVLWHLRDLVNIKKKKSSFTWWRHEGRTRNEIGKLFDEEFRDAFTDAIRTAK